MYYVLCLESPTQPVIVVCIGYSSSHTIQTTKNMNGAKYVSIYLLCSTNYVVVEYFGVEIKASADVLALLRARNNRLQGMALPALLTWIPWLITRTTDTQ